MYSPATYCPKCNLTQKGLSKAGIPFTSITADEDSLQWFRSEGHQSFPVVVVDGVIAWSDYRPDKIKELA